MCDPRVVLTHSLHTANASQVVNSFMAILIGSVALTNLSDIQGEFISSLTGQVRNGPPAITNGRAAAAALYATIERVPDIDSASPEGLKPGSVFGEITLENIRFSYPSRPDVPVLKGINITFEARKTAALVGASGSGKSTIVSLVERFYDPLSGSIKLDGVALADLNLKWLRSQIGLVSQEPVLFSTTIKENVAYGLIGSPYEHAPDEEKFKLVQEACIKSNADEFITKLPHGYETMVGERGFLLSGGQRQRVAIARAIVSDPRILLLDEATSALDTQSEGIVQDALDKASAGRTTISIAHRLSTIKDVDQIFVMGEGAVLEHGTHQELLANGGPYAQLVEAQELREETAAQNDNDNDIAAVSSDVEKVDAEKTVPSREDSLSSVPSGLALEKSAERKWNRTDDYTFFYLFRRIGSLARPWYTLYTLGTCSSIGKFLGQYFSSITEPIKFLAWSIQYTVLSLVGPTFVPHEIHSMGPSQGTCCIF